MYYRRKIILQLLSALGGPVEQLRLQKLMFLFSQQQPGEKEALKAKDATLLQQLVEAFGHYTIEELLQYTYTQYPYYALKTQVWENYLTQEAWEKAHAAITYRQQRRKQLSRYCGKKVM